MTGRARSLIPWLVGLAVLAVLGVVTLARSSAAELDPKDGPQGYPVACEVWRCPSWTGPVPAPEPEFMCCPAASGPPDPCPLSSLDDCPLPNIWMWCEHGASVALEDGTEGVECFDG